MLPDFPVDDGTLDLLMSAMYPGPEAECSSLWPLLTMFSQMGGSDTNAVDEIINDGSDGSSVIRLMRDPQYMEHDVIAALIVEVRRLRALVAKWGHLAEVNHG